MMLARGELLGGYRIDDIIGLGGMAIVYRAEQVSLGRPVALKVLAPQLSHDEAFKERFRREGKHIAALDHPHVLTVFDSGEIDGHLYLAMRLVDGNTLADRMQDRGLTIEESLEILKPMADALDAAHAAGLVHRDVKPQNILISKANQPYLADFGVAKGSSSTMGLTATGGFVGSINYASPEQIRGEPAIPAGDVYALTAVLYQCLSGEVPYPLDTDAGIMHAHLFEPPPTLKSLLPPAQRLNDVIARGMAKEPTQRYTSAGAMIRDALAAAASLSVTERHSVPDPAGTGNEEGEPNQAPLDRVESATGEKRTDPIVNDARAAVEIEPQSAAADRPPSVEAARPVETDGRSREAAARRLANQTEIVDRPVGKAARRSADHTAADKRREPSRPPEAPRPPRKPKLRRLLVAGALGVAVIAGACAAILSGGSTPSAHARLRTVRSGPLALTLGSPWRLFSGSTPVSFAFAGAPAPVSLTAGHASVVVAGVLLMPATIPAGAPPELVARDGKPVADTAAQIGGHAGRRYEWNLSNRTQLIAYVLSTASSDLAILCALPAAHTSATTACATLVSTAKVTGTTVLAPGPDADLQSTLSSALGPVARARTSVGGLDATKLQARAGTAANDAKAERRGLAGLKATTPPARYRGAVTALSSALALEASGFSSLADAARANRRKAYTDARAQIMSASRLVSRAATGLATEGFKLPALRALTIPGLPATSRPASSTATTVTPPSTSAAGTPAQTQGNSQPTTGSSTPTTSSGSSSSSSGNGGLVKAKPLGGGGSKSGSRHLVPASPLG
jgi:serine/threonine protein kinase